MGDARLIGGGGWLRFWVLVVLVDCGLLFWISGRSQYL